MFGGSTHDGLQLQGSRLFESSGLGFRDSGLGIGVNGAMSAYGHATQSL